MDSVITEQRSISFLFPYWCVTYGSLLTHKRKVVILLQTSLALSQWWKIAQKSLIFQLKCESFLAKNQLIIPNKMWAQFGKVLKMRHFWPIFKHCALLNLHKLKLGSVGIFPNYCGSLIHTWWSCFWPCFDSLDTKLNDSQVQAIEDWKMSISHISITKLLLRSNFSSALPHLWCSSALCFALYTRFLATLAFFTMNFLTQESIIIHSVWKSQKKSLSTLRAKRSTIWVVKSSQKMPKMVD